MDRVLARCAIHLSANLVDGFVALGAQDSVIGMALVAYHPHFGSPHSGSVHNKNDRHLPCMENQQGN